MFSWNKLSSNQKQAILLGISSIAISSLLWLDIKYNFICLIFVSLFVIIPFLGAKTLLGSGRGNKRHPYRFAALIGLAYGFIPMIYLTLSTIIVPSQKKLADYPSIRIHSFSPIELKFFIIFIITFAIIVYPASSILMGLFAAFLSKKKR
jgi:hypothetical protein